jgi:hypothetical protein
MCPLCLAKDTRISTPSGDMLVQGEIRGIYVWTMDKDGKKVARRVKAVKRMPTPKSHRVTHLVLTDFRELWVSPDHPTSTGSRVGDLVTGESYDGARVVTAELVPYWSDTTYDILPDGDTGLYWANGILMGSTLKAP